MCLYQDVSLLIVNHSYVKPRPER